MPLLGLHTKETRIERDTCTPVFITMLFTIARIWKQPRCPSADKWVIECGSVQFSSVQSLSRVQLFATPWTAAHQAYLSITNSWSLPKLMSIESVMPSISSSVIPFSSCPQSLPASGSFPVSQLFAWGGQSIGVSASRSVFPMNAQDWSPLWWTGWISLQSKGLSRVFSNTTVQKLYIYTYRQWTITQLLKRTHLNQF